MSHAYMEPSFAILVTVLKRTVYQKKGPRQIDKITHFPDFSKYPIAITKLYNFLLYDVSRLGMAKPVQYSHKFRQYTMDVNGKQKVTTGYRSET